MPHCSYCRPKGKPCDCASERQETKKKTKKKRESHNDVEAVTTGISTLSMTATVGLDTNPTQYSVSAIPSTASGSYDTYTSFADAYPDHTYLDNTYRYDTYYGNTDVENADPELDSGSSSFDPAFVDPTLTAWSQSADPSASTFSPSHAPLPDDFELGGPASHESTASHLTTRQHSEAPQGPGWEPETGPDAGGQPHGGHYVETSEHGEGYGGEASWAGADPATEQAPIGNSLDSSDWDYFIAETPHEEAAEQGFELNYPETEGRKRSHAGSDEETGTPGPVSQKPRWH